MTIKVFNKVCTYAGDIIVPLFETPFFAHGASRDCVLGNSRETVAYAGGTSSGQPASGFYYRPNATVLNVTTNKIEVSDSGIGPGAVCSLGNYIGQIFRPSGVGTRWAQWAPVGANVANPLVSRVTTVPLDPSHSSTMILNAAGGNHVYFAMMENEGILNGNAFFVFNPLFPSVEHVILNGPQYSGTGEQARYMTLENVVTNFDDDNNYFICGGAPAGGPPCNVVRWGNLPNGDVDGTRWIMSFDDPSIDSQLNGGSALPHGLRSTRAGWLVPTLSQIDAWQRFDTILISKTGDNWRRIRFSAQTSRAAAMLINPALILAYAAHIDISGIFYIFDYNDDGRLYTSFGLNIPLQAPLIPATALPNFPCWPPCYPLGLDQPAM